MQTCPVRADITAIEGVISATPTKASVILGDSVKIPLVGVLPGNFKPFDFGIIKQPEFGVLGKIVTDPTDSSRAWVVYTPKPGADPGKDTFRYNAKLTGKKASPSEEISITLRNPVARLRVDPVLAFGKVEVGTSKSVPMTISNGGTKQFSVNLLVPSPWSIPKEQRELVIGPGSDVIVDVIFAPMTVKPSKFLLTLQAGNPEGSIEMIGAGGAPFETQVGTLELKWDEAEGSRTGTVRLANRTNRELPLKLTAPVEIEVERLVVLPPGEAVNLAVRLGGIKAFDGKVLVESEHFKDELPVSAKATPASIEVLKPAESRRFDLEMMDTDTPPVFDVVVRNTGGKTAFIYGETSRPFFVKEGRDPTEVASGETMKITVSIDPSEVGPYQRTLSVLGTANKITFDLQAVISRNVDRSVVGVSQPGLAPVISAKEAELYGMLPSKEQRVKGINDRKRVTIDDLPSVEQVYLEHQGRRELVLSWDHPGSADLDYLLEVEVYQKSENGIPEVVWYQADEHVKVEKDDKTATMTLKKLVPGRQFRFRILTMNKDGHTSAPSRAELVYTLGSKGFNLWLLVPILLILGGGGFYFWRRRQFG